MQVNKDTGDQRLRRADRAQPQQRKELWARLLSIAPLCAGYEKHTSREIPMVILRPVDEQRH